MSRALALALLLGCGTAPHRDPVRAATTPPALASEAPQPVAVRINAEYARKQAEDWRSFEREGREVFDHRDEILAALAIAPGMRVADVGAGTGLFSLAMARVVGDGGVVFAVDVQAYFLEHIAARARDEQLGNVKPVLADQQHTGLAPETIDVALLCDSYHHLERPRTYLADLHAALVEGGRLVVIDYDRTRPGTRAWMKDHVRADPEEFRREIEGAGFRLIAAPALLRENFVMVFERA